jgi:hypothetical protein
MELISLELPKKTKKELKTEMMPAKLGDEGPKYPYGFELRFESEQIEKFPELKDAKKGTKFIIRGIGEVTGWNKSDQKGGKERYSATLQLQKVALSTTSEKKSTLIGDIEKSKKGEIK